MIKNKIKKILKISNIFLKDSFQELNIINYNNKKLNKKSIYFWMIFILFFALFFVSQEVIKFLKPRGLSEIFLNIYFLFMSILIMFQTVLVCTNVFYFSKDIENILPLPITPIELLLSKFITLISKIYISESIFGIIPIIIYGIYNNSNILFYFYTLVILLIFPIFLSLFIIIIMMFIMKISKYIKNKDMFQIIITIILISIIFFLQYKLLGNIIINNTQEEIKEQEQIIEKILEFNNKIKEANKNFLVLNPSIDCLIKSDLNSIINIIKIIFIDLSSLIIFIIVGKFTYLKDILRNNTYLINKKNKIINLNKKIKKRIKSKEYIKKEFKLLFRNPMIFIQCVFPVFIFIITLIIMSIIIKPRAEMLFSNQEFISKIGDISFDITAVYITLGIMQILFMISTVALTGFSREGKNTIFIKYIPISLYKQFIYKSVPQIFINTFSIFTVVGLLYYFIPELEIKYFLYIFILGFLLNIINSFMMLIIDLLNPKLNWDTEYALFKQNNNKIFQYIFSLIIILLLVYFDNIFKKTSIDIEILITGIIFNNIIILINIIIKIKQKKLFKKIN